MTLNSLPPLVKSVVDSYNGTVEPSLDHLAPFERETCLCSLVYKANKLGNSKDVLKFYSMLDFAETDTTLDVHNIYKRAVEALQN